MSAEDPHSNPDYMPKDEALNYIWVQMFGHGYTQCKWLSTIPGELGEQHRKHREWFLKYTDKDQYKS